jgi:signal transduction histidine kinase
MSSTSLDRLRHTIGFRLTLWYSGVFMLSVLILFALSYALLWSSLRHTDQENITQELHELAALYHDSGEAGVSQELELQQRLQGTQAFFVRLADPHQQTHMLVIPEQWGAFHLKRVKKMAATADLQWVEVPGHGGGSRLEVASLGLLDGSVLQVGKSTADRRHVLGHFREVSASVILAVILLGVGCGTLLAFHALRPIRHLIQTVQSIEGGTMDSRVPRRATGDELDELGRLFNAMLDRIAGLIQGMRGALDNVAHDLRTPLTRIRGTAEIALGSAPNVESYRDALADCVEESDRLLTMLNTLMDISEAETGTLTLALEHVNISALLEDAIDLYREVAEEKGLAVKMSTPQDLWVHADRHRLRQVIANLLDNAIKYTPPGGHIDCIAYQAESQVVLVVEDTGMGIAVEEIPKIWERLYRGEGSRTHRGLGLGLSLVRAVVHAHGGTVEVSSAPGAGSRFTLALPLTPVHSQ